MLFLGRISICVTIFNGFSFFLLIKMISVMIRIYIYFKQIQLSILIILSPSKNKNKQNHCKPNLCEFIKSKNQKAEQNKQ